MTQQAALWPGWDVVAELGSGSFGKVYEIRRNTFGHVERAALKVIHIPRDQSELDALAAQGYSRQQIVARLWQQLQGILGEYNRMSDIKGHTNVVYCDDFRYAQHSNGLGWTLYIKMELLTPMLRTVRLPVSQVQVIRLGMDMCRALELCRSRSIVHRDIKPQNIFVSRDGDYKLGDFGIAKTAAGIYDGTKVGTFQYMAPEVFHAKPYGAQADLYSLGMVLYWMLNRCRLPFIPQSASVITDEMDETARRRRFSGEPLPPPVDGSAQLRDVVLRACAFDPGARFATAQEMYLALSAVPAVDSTPCGTVTVPGSLWKKAEDLS